MLIIYKYAYLHVHCIINVVGETKLKKMNMQTRYNNQIQHLEDQPERESKDTLEI